MWLKTGLLLAISKRICLGLTLSAHSFSKTHPTSARREIQWVISKKTKYFVSTSLHRSLRLYNEQINDLMINPSTLWVSRGTSFLITARMGRKDVLQSIELEGQGYPLLILLHHLELGLWIKYILSQPESWFGLESLISAESLSKHRIMFTEVLPRSAWRSCPWPCVAEQLCCNDTQVNISSLLALSFVDPVVHHEKEHVQDLFPSL